jgi:hypothetical protein
MIAISKTDEEKKERKRLWRIANADKLKEQHRVWNAKRYADPVKREAKNAKERERRKANRESYIERNRKSSAKHYANNKEKRKQQDKLSKQKRRDATKGERMMRDHQKAIAKEKARQATLWKIYEKAWVMDIKVKEFDWSYLWYKEQSRRNMINRYQIMTDDQKKQWNKKCYTTRKSNPLRMAKNKLAIKHWKNCNPEKARQQARKSSKKRKSIDPGYKVQCNLRSRLKDLMKTTKKGGSETISLLIGCSTFDLAKHLESQFAKWMTWDNYGTKWHVDHIMPCFAFDHTKPLQVRQCWHYTNLRPLCAKQNMSKGATITHPQLSLAL